LEARVSARALYDDLWVVGGRAVSNGGRDVALWSTPWRPPVLAETKETKASSSTSCLSEGVLGWVGSGGLGLWWLLHGLLLGCGGGLLHGLHGQVSISLIFSLF
jgi:hypothetical protein